MKTARTRAHDPLRLDVERFVREGAHLEGSWPLAGMARLVDACHEGEGPDPDDAAEWSARGEQRHVGGEVQAWLHLTLRASLKLTCQRCLAAVGTPLEVDRWFRFVPGEDEAQALDAEMQEDVLARPHALDLHQLAEDELLLALPIVPRHDVCPVPLRAAGPQAPAEPAPSPFAALARLKEGMGH